MAKRRPGHQRKQRALSFAREYRGRPRCCRFVLIYPYISQHYVLQVIVTVFESQIACIICPWGIFVLSWQFCHICHIITCDRHMLLFMDEAYLISDVIKIMILKEIDIEMRNKMVKIVRIFEKPERHYKL